MNASATLRQTIQYATHGRLNREASIILLTRMLPWRFRLDGAAAHVNGDRFWDGPGEDLETHGVANPAGELDN